MQRHRHQEFIGFLNAIEAQVPAKKLVFFASQAATEARCLPMRRRSPSYHHRFVAETNHDPKPFTWTADPDKIIAAVRRGHQVLDSIH